MHELNHAFQVKSTILDCNTQVIFRKRIRMHELNHAFQVNSILY